jgi:putative salt-induced outer membrane protein YdiY
VNSLTRETSFVWRWVGLLIGLVMLPGFLLRGDDFSDQPGVQRLPAVDPLAAPAWLKPADEAAVIDPGKVWTGSLELGLNGSQGNAVNFNLHTGFDISRQTAGGVFEVEFDYAKVNSSGFKTDHHALLDMEHKWTGESRLGGFVHFAFDYDEFKAFDSRISANGGLDYRLVSTELTELLSRWGAGFSQELGGPTDRTVPEAIFGLDLKRQVTERQQFEMNVQYFPDWSRFSDFRLETDVAWKILLDQARDLSLKFDLNDRYDNTPGGLRPNDVTYAVLLLWEL